MTEEEVNEVVSRYPGVLFKSVTQSGDGSLVWDCKINDSYEQTNQQFSIAMGRLRDELNDRDDEGHEVLNDGKPFLVAEVTLDFFMNRYLDIVAMNKFAKKLERRYHGLLEEHSDQIDFPQSVEDLGDSMAKFFKQAMLETLPGGSKLPKLVIDLLLYHEYSAMFAKMRRRSQASEILKRILEDDDDDIMRDDVGSSDD